MNPFYVLLVLVSAMAMPVLIYGQQKVQQSSTRATKIYMDTVHINNPSITNFSKKELMKMEVVKFHPGASKIKAGTPAGNLSAKERVKSNIVKQDSQQGRVVLPATIPVQNLSAKEKMKIAVTQQ